MRGALGYYFGFLQKGNHMSPLHQARKRAFRRLAWSLTALFHGVFPELDDLGKPWPAGSLDEARAGSALADGYRAVLYVLKGDLDYIYKSLGLPNSGATEPCAWCPCNLTTLPWWDMRLCLTLQNHLYTAATVLINMCVLFSLPGTSLMCISPDWTHDKNLGTDMYFYGSVMHILVYQVLTGTPASNLERITAQIKAAYKAAGISVRFQNLTLSA